MELLFATWCGFMYAECVEPRRRPFRASLSAAPLHPAMKQKKLLTPTSGVSGGGILDKNLVPRITNYAMNHSISDLDEVAEGLRSTYRDYQRWKMPTFKQMVARAIKVVQIRGGAVKPELQLQVGEE